MDLPVEMIEHAEHTGERTCRDHSHPTIRITLKEPKDPEGKILLTLLAQAAPSPSEEVPVPVPFQGPHVPLQTRPGFGGSVGIGRHNCTSVCVWLSGGINPDGSIDVGTWLRCINKCSDIFNISAIRPN